MSPGKWERIETRKRHFHSSNFAFHSFAFLALTSCPIQRSATGAVRYA